MQPITRAVPRLGQSHRTTLALAALLLCACGSRTGLKRLGATPPDDGAIADLSRRDITTDVGFDTRLPACSCRGAALLSEDEGAPSAIAVDDTHVYWASRGSDCSSGEIRRVRKCGGAVEVIAKGQPSPNAIALDAARVYFYNGCGSGILRSVAKSGGPLRTYPIKVEDSGRALAVGSDDIYFSDYGLLRIAKDGSGAQVAVEPNYYVYAVAADARGAVWMGPGRGASSFYGVLAYRPGDAAPTKLASPTGVGNALAIDADAVYFGASGGIARVARSGGDAVAVAAGPSWRIAVDDAHVYWTDGFAGGGGYKVYKAPKSGGERSLVASGDGAYVDLAVDDRCVYVANLYGRQIRSFPK
ncbi:MAG: hypothetical protein KC503_39135 [Myxococcales bacterium]|nr:hypothetical protein [Myxococcales bacterium]